MVFDCCTDFRSPPIVQHTTRNSKCLMAMFTPHTCLRTVHVPARWYDGTLVCRMFDKGITRSIQMDDGCFDGKIHIFLIMKEQMS